jgi:hypothetical protein
VLGHVSRDQRALSPTWSERNLSIQKDSIPPITCVDQGLRMSGQASLDSTSCGHGIEILSHFRNSNPSAQQTEWGPDLNDQRLRMLYELGTWHPQSWVLIWEIAWWKNLAYPVITTHTHDNFKCLSPWDYVDIKSWLSYEQNPYSTRWVRSSVGWTKTLHALWVRCTPPTTLSTVSGAN